MVNGVSMDNVEHAFAVQQLRKSGKNAKIVSEYFLPLDLCTRVSSFWKKYLRAGFAYAKQKQALRGWVQFHLSYNSSEFFK